MALRGCCCDVVRRRRGRLLGRSCGGQSGPAPPGAVEQQQQQLSSTPPAPRRLRAGLRTRRVRDPQWPLPRCRCRKTEDPDLRTSGPESDFAASRACPQHLQRISCCARGTDCCRRAPDDASSEAPWVAPLKPAVSASCYLPRKQHRRIRSQPMLKAVEMSLAGRGQGEVTAACVAAILVKYLNVHVGAGAGVGQDAHQS